MLTNLGARFCRFDDLRLVERNRLVPSFLDALDGDTRSVVDVWVCDGGERPIAVAAVTGRENLHVEALGGGVDELPELRENRVMQARIDLIDEKRAASRMNERYRYPQHSRDALAK